MNGLSMSGLKILPRGCSPHLALQKTPGSHLSILAVHLKIFRVGGNRPSRLDEAGRTALEVADREDGKSKKWKKKVKLPKGTEGGIISRFIYRRRRTRTVRPII
jgi:hypothetical protein